MGKAIRLAISEADKHEIIAKALSEDILKNGHAEIAEALKLLVSFCLEKGGENHENIA